MYFKRLYDLRTDNDLTQEQVSEYLTCNPQDRSKFKDIGNK